MLVRRQIIGQLQDEVKSKMKVQLLSRNVGIRSMLTDIGRLTLSDYVVCRLEYQVRKNLSEVGGLVKECE
jgi:hypothetical protein